MPKWLCFLSDVALVKGWADNMSQSRFRSPRNTFWVPPGDDSKSWQSPFSMTIPIRAGTEWGGRLPPDEAISRKQSQFIFKSNELLRRQTTRLMDKFRN